MHVVHPESGVLSPELQVGGYYPQSYKWGDRSPIAPVPTLMALEHLESCSAMCQMTTA